MHRRDAIAALVAERGDAITVTTEQAIGAWRAAVPEPANEIPDHLDIVGCMGAASAIALGIALAKPERRVIIVDGDGSLLMQLGSLVTIAGAAPANLYHFVFENGVYETSGSQPLPGEGRFDLAEMARAAGYVQSLRFDDSDQFAARLPDILKSRGPAFISVRTEPEDGFLVRSSAGTKLDIQMHALHRRLTGPQEG
ncbi:MAG: thiamine pyrophosphate-binding protein [Chloroflexi bacterium]|nr:thiamine pyrophosphate-binding protein [Chloroflexota bacterium]MBV9545924.1 thiamine pyrophosphate-binding protein [Chloroflexota bacterium]